MEAVVWLLTNTTYGTWLPGDDRGWVTRAREEDGGEVRAVILPGNAALRRTVQQAMKGAPIYLTREQAETLLSQFLETSAFRGWAMIAVSIMPNHWHLVIQASGEWTADRILADLKAYGTRALSRKYGEPASKTWWTGKGWKKRLPDESAEASEVKYVLYKQTNPLVVWSRELGRII